MTSPDLQKCLTAVVGRNGHLLCRIYATTTEFFTEVRFNHIRICLNLSRNALNDHSSEIKYQDSISYTHYNRHIMLNQNLSHTELLFDIQDDQRNVLRFLQAHTRDWLIQ